MQRMTPDAGFHIERPGPPDDRDRALDGKYPRITRAEDPLLNLTSSTGRIGDLPSFLALCQVREPVEPSDR